MPNMQMQFQRSTGLYSQFNPVSAAPEGSLLEADNCVIDREGVIGLRRGFERYHDDAFTKINAIGEFKDSLLVLNGNNIEHSADGSSWTAWTETHNPVDDDTRVRFSEVRGNLYWTTSKGLWKNDKLDGTPVRSGMPQGLDTEVSLEGDGTGWFSSDSQVGYRVAWVRTDESGYELRGAPSFREHVANPQYSVALDWNGGVVRVAHAAHGYTTGDLVTISGTTGGAGTSMYEGTFAVTSLGDDSYSYEMTTQPGEGKLSDEAALAGKAYEATLRFSIPSGVVAGDTWELYRTELSASALTSPGDRHFKIAEGVVTSGDISTQYVEFSDDKAAVFLGVELYTNQTVETASQANDRPPHCHDFTTWKGYPWYANTKREHELEFEITDISGLLDTAIDIATQSFTGKAAENVALEEFRVSTSESTTAANIRETAKSLVRVINRKVGFTVEAHYISGTEDPPGKILIRSNSFASGFTAEVDEGDKDYFSPDLYADGNGLSSRDNAKINNLKRGKFEQPEAAPRLTGSVPLGSERYGVVRILALRDSLIVLKEEGIWRVTGESESSFVYKQLDPSTKILAPESAVVLDNAVYVLTNQGVCKVSESGTAIISRPIEDQIKRVFAFDDFKKLSHAVAYESDRKYILFTQEDSANTHAKVAWVYDFITRAWTRWKKPVSCAHVSFSGDRLFLGHAEDHFVLRERKSFGTMFKDYQDESVVVGQVSDVDHESLNADGETVTKVTVSYTYPGFDLKRGCLFHQTIPGDPEVEVEGVIESVTEAEGANEYEILLDEVYDEIKDYGAVPGCVNKVVLPIPARIRWTPEGMGSPAVTKQVAYAQIYLERNSASDHKFGFITDANNSEELLSVRTATARGWGISEWGTSGWGSEGEDVSTPIRVVVPSGHQRCRTISAIYEHCFAGEHFEILNVGLTYRMVSERTAR